MPRAMAIARTEMKSRARENAGLKFLKFKSVRKRKTIGCNIFAPKSDPQMKLKKQRETGQNLKKIAKSAKRGGLNLGKYCEFDEKNIRKVCPPQGDC